MSEVATFLKVGTTALVLSMIEDGVFPKELVIKDPVAQIKRISRDDTLRHVIETVNGRRLTALAVQRLVFEACDKYLANADADPVGGDAAEVMYLWDEVLSGLESDPNSVGHIVDWVAKRRIVHGYQDRHGLKSGHPRLKAIDLQYHDMRESHCLASRAGLRTFVSDVDVLDAISEPPKETRAWFRGKCLQRWPDQIVAANWDSIVFDVGVDPLRRVPMMEPLRGSESLTKAILDSSDTAAALIEALGASDIDTVYPEPGW
jgi:proteasome accessory factor A